MRQLLYARKRLWRTAVVLNTVSAVISDVDKDATGVSLVPLRLIATISCMLVSEFIDCCDLPVVRQAVAKGLARCLVRKTRHGMCAAAGVGKSSHDLTWLLETKTHVGEAKSIRQQVVRKTTRLRRYPEMLCHASVYSAISERDSCSFPVPVQGHKLHAVGLVLAVAPAVRSAHQNITRMSAGRGSGAF